MFRTVLAASMGIGLMGCGAVGSQTQSTNGLVFATNRVFDGRPFSALVMRYGPPAGHRTRDGLNIYQFYAPTDAGVPESVQAANGGMPRAYTAAYVEQPTAARAHDQRPISSPCTMRVRVAIDGTVQTIDFIGQLDACSIFMP